MLSQKSTMKTKLENMYLQKRISYGYRKVINMMLLSGVISIIAIGILFANMMNYVNNVNAADQAVKTCRININTAARKLNPMWAFGSLLFFDYRETNASPAPNVLTTQNTSRPKVPIRKLSPSKSKKTEAHAPGFHEIATRFLFHARCRAAASASQNGLY